jgi:hypothetical protein
VVAFTKVSAATSIRSTLSLPPYRGPGVVGSLNIYGDVEGAFSGMEADIAATFGAQGQAIIRNADLSASTNPDCATADNAPEEEGARTSKIEVANAVAAGGARRLPRRRHPGGQQT